MILLSFFLFFLVPSEQHQNIDNYALDIVNNKLVGVQICGEPPVHLNLSYLGIDAINENAFNNLDNLKTLNLGNNKLKRLPSSSDLSNLESLILEDNKIESGKFYSGLNKLEILNIAGNPIKLFEPGHFYGLSKSINIWTKGLQLKSISPALFEYPANVKNRENFVEDLEEHGIDEDVDTYRSGLGNNGNIQLCVEDGHLMSVKSLKIGESIPIGCAVIGLKYRKLFLVNMGIKTFEKGWYQLENEDIMSIVLSHNKISELTSELLNDLPAGIRQVYLSNNQIKVVNKGIMKSRNNIDILHLGDNLITDIEYGAFENLNLTGGLFLDHNHLRDTTFLDSLPLHVRHVSMNHNEITELTPGYFTMFKELKWLSLADNKIKEIKSFQLYGLTSLTHLSLRMNGLKRFESSPFQDLTNLSHLDLSDNKISRLADDIFSGLYKMKHINLYNNKIEEPLRRLLRKMPRSLQKLWLGRNQIKGGGDEISSSGPTSESGSRSIQSAMNMRGTYNLPNLRLLDLQNNSLVDIDSDSFEGLDNLGILSLAGNEIQTIQKGLTRNLGNLHILDLSDNPITKLTNGTLFGLSKDSKTIVRVENVPLKSIQGGVFDDV